MTQVIIKMPDTEGADVENIDFLNGEWDIVGCPCAADAVHTFGQNWSVVECHVQIQRQPLFYMINLGFPIILLLAIGALAFCLPPDSGDKINLSITIFLALTVFIMVIMDHLPATSQAIPLLGKNYSILVSKLSSIVKLSIHFKSCLHFVPLSQSVLHILCFLL